MQWFNIGKIQRQRGSENPNNSFNPMMNIQLITDLSKIDTRAWTAFVMDHPDGSVFHLPVVYEIYKETPGNYPVLLLATNQNNKIKGLILVAVISDFGKWNTIFNSRAIIYAGPLIENDLEDKATLLDQLLTHLISYLKKRSLFIEFRNFSDFNEFKEVYSKNRFVFRPWLNFTLNSINLPDFINRFSTSKKRQVIKSIKAGAIVRPVESMSEVETVYQHLTDLYKNKIKKPLPPLEFFRNIYSLATIKNEGVILVVVFNNMIVGGMVAMITPGKTLYEWYIFGLDKNFKMIHPSVMATWGGIDYGSKHGLKKFDFMGIGQPDSDYGVRDFKMRFGGELHTFGRFIRINNRFLFNIAKFGFNLQASLRKGINHLK